MLLTGALFPSVGGFEGKGMAFRLPIFAFPALIVPLLRLRPGNRSQRYPVELDAGLTLPFLFDTFGNAVGLYDHWNPTDDVLHVVNWFVLFGGVTVALYDSARRHGSPRWLVWLAGAGAGAWAIIGWEAAEYAVMEAGVGGLSLTYADTLGDLLGSSTGGAIGAWCALRWLRPEQAVRP